MALQTFVGVEEIPAAEGTIYGRVITIIVAIPELEHGLELTASRNRITFTATQERRIHLHIGRVAPQIGASTMLQDRCEHRG